MGNSRMNKKKLFAYTNEKSICENDRNWKCLHRILQKFVQNFSVFLKKTSLLSGKIWYTMYGLFQGLLSAP